VKSKRLKGWWAHPWVRRLAITAVFAGAVSIQFLAAHRPTAMGVTSAPSPVARSA